ncbi:GNAT family N-acetyltransferase [Streptomyces coeruleorubidus]|uniref:GNAT family N-acetyltransferase n=1 Tax=Streptomyces coeruleorubidus TaxID=116188 RepID=UPI0033E5FCA5
MGWRLGRSHWGQGLATEAAEAAVRFGFEERRLERIVSITQVGNDASERSMTKLGMHPVRETVNPTCGRRGQGRDTLSGRSRWKTATACPGPL